MVGSAARFSVSASISGRASLRAMAGRLLDRVLQHRSGTGGASSKPAWPAGQQIDQPQPLGADRLGRGDDQRLAGGQHHRHAPPGFGDGAVHGAGAGCAEAGFRGM